MPPARHLFLLRHAKSSWDDPGLIDHDRPLASRGRKAAAKIGELLRRREISPKLVLCSSAARARETLERVSPSGEVRVEEQLYGASAGDLLERLQQVPDDVASVMLIGHNPSIERLALTLARDGELNADVARKFPTGALATLEFDSPWAALGRDCAELTDFVRPRDL